MQQGMLEMLLGEIVAVSHHADILLPHTVTCLVQNAHCIFCDVRLTIIVCTTVGEIYHVLSPHLNYSSTFMQPGDTMNNFQLAQNAKYIILFGCSSGTHRRSQHEPFH